MPHSLEIRSFERRSYATELSQGDVDAVISVGGDRDGRSLVDRTPVATDRLVCLFGPLCPLATGAEVTVFLETSRQQQRRPETAGFSTLVETAIRTVLPRSA